MAVFEAIADPFIGEGVAAAVEKTLLPAMVLRVYRGHFTVTADGSHFGTDVTWPGLDSWEMAGAYLLLGHRQVVLDYFDFVRASQRADGNIPFAIFPADVQPEGTDTYLRGLRYPLDVYTHAGRRWIGLFSHWQAEVNPLSVLAAVCYILTAGEIVAAGTPPGWLPENIESVEAAGRYLLSRKSPNGLIGGAGFYIECPPRNQWDGVTQCYAVKALRTLARLSGDGGGWNAHADRLADAFRQTFWRGDHFAEYVHPERGVIDLRRLSDVNLAAIGLDVASDEQAKQVWPRLVNEPSFWHGGMPTQLVSLPNAYEPWEWPEPLPFKHANGPVYDVAAMGRVWYLESLACARMSASDRLRESVSLVCRMGEQHGWQWHERYHARPDGTVAPAGPKGYCEYAAVLVRIVLGNPKLFLNVNPGGGVS